MKKIILLLVLWFLTAPCFGAMTYSITSKPTNDWWTGQLPNFDVAWAWAKEVEDRIEYVTANGAFFFDPTDVAPTSSEGMLYYNDTLNSLVLYNGSSWQTIDLAGGTSLDSSYNLGSAITVDGNPIALTVGSADNNSALTIDHGETTNNNDAFTIAHSGSGDAIQVTVAETDGVASRFIAAASQTTSLSVLDSATNNWDGADNVGMVHISDDTALIHAGASLLNVTHATAQPITGAEGFLARFISTGTAQTNAHAVEIETTNTQPALMLNNLLTITGTNSTGTLVAITGADTTGNTDTMTIAHSGTGAALKITSSEADTQLIELASAANQTTWLELIDGSTGDWIGANDVGMLHVQGDTAGANAGASLLQVTNSAQPISAAEGFLARFVDTGTARTNAHAVEIETTNTTPALMLNNQLTITGADSAGILMAITGNDTTGDTDTVTLNGAGSGDVLQITADDADSVGLKVIAAASQTTSLAVFEGSTSNWDGADNIGMVYITTDDPVIHTGASLLNVTQSGQAIAAAEGFLARFIASGTARTDATAVEIEVAATQPALAVNGITKINGQDAAGATLFQVAGVGASGNADAMLISNTGSGNCLQVTPGEVDSGGINATSLASSTVPMINLDGATNNWDGADNIGQLTLTQDDAVVHTGATQLMVHNTGTTIAAAEGFLARFVQDTGAAVTDAYAVEIEVTATTGAFKADGHCLIDDDLYVNGTLANPVTAGTKVVAGVPVLIEFRPTAAETLTYTVPTGYDLIVTDAHGWKIAAAGSGANDDINLQHNDGSAANIFDAEELDSVGDKARFVFDNLDDAENELEAGETLDCVTQEASSVDCIIVVTGYLKTAD